MTDTIAFSFKPGTCIKAPGNAYSCERKADPSGINVDYSCSVSAGPAVMGECHYDSDKSGLYYSRCQMGPPNPNEKTDQISFVCTETRNVSKP
jgi:hypothetical protein